MKQEISPKDSGREEAFNLWIKSPMPMVTLTKTFDITRVRRVSKKRELKLNMLLCWCIGRAASQIKEFFVIPENGRLFKYDRLAVNVIVNNVRGGINSCDIPFVDNLEQFNADYLKMTEAVKNSCESIFNEDYMIVGTSAVVATELDCIVNQYTDLFSNPMVMWGKYRKRWLRNTLPISFQFHHVQMDGAQAAQFLESLQRTFDAL